MKKQSELDMLLAQVKAGNIYAYYNLGYIYLLGQGVPEDPKKAVEYFQKGARSGDGKCMMAMAMCYKNGDGVEPDEKEMIAWLERGARINDPFCLYRLGLCYENGEGVSSDLDKAAELMQRCGKKHKEARRWLKDHHYIRRSWL